MKRTDYIWLFRFGLLVVTAALFLTGNRDGGLLFGLCLIWAFIAIDE